MLAIPQVPVDTSDLIESSHDPNSVAMQGNVQVRFFFPGLTLENNLGLINWIVPYAIYITIFLLHTKQSFEAEIKFS